MKIGVISDIHANLPALKGVLKDIDKRGRVDLLICLGDFIGYGPYPNEVCNTLKKEKNFLAVLGDHDYALVKRDFSGLDTIARETIKWTLEKITKDNFDFLKSLEVLKAIRVEGYNLVALHGSPDDYLKGYIYEDDPEEKLRRYLQITNASIILCGHTHVPFVKKINEKFILNPGSVGQPRDRDSRASYMILDIKRSRKIKAEIIRIKYDIEEIIDKIRKEGLPKEICERLKRGW